MWVWQLGYAELLSQLVLGPGRCPSKKSSSIVSLSQPVSQDNPGALVSGPEGSWVLSQDPVAGSCLVMGQVGEGQKGQGHS